MVRPCDSRQSKIWGALYFLTGTPHPEESENDKLVHLTKIKTRKQNIPPKSALTCHLLKLLLAKASAFWLCKPTLTEKCYKSLFFERNLNRLYKNPFMLKTPTGAVLFILYSIARGCSQNREQGPELATLL